MFYIPHDPMKYLSFFLSVAILLTLGCGSSKRKQLVKNAPLISQTYQDHLGRSLQLDQSPSRIVSIAPNITEIIFAIGGEDKLAAVSEACDFPEETEYFQKITTYPELDIEALTALKPDMILTTDEIFTPDAIAQLERFSLPVYVQSYQGLEDVYRGIREIGELLEVSQRANRVADSLQSLEKRITDSTENQINYRTLILISADPLKVVGGTGFLHEMIEMAGGLNVFENAEEAYYTTTVEEILLAQPEFLIIPSKSQQAYADLLASHPQLYNTPADVYKQVHIIDPDLMYRPGPRMLDGLLSLTHILHTQLNPQKFYDVP